MSEVDTARGRHTAERRQRRKGIKDNNCTGGRSTKVEEFHRWPKHNFTGGRISQVALARFHRWSRQNSTQVAKFHRWQNCTVGKISQVAKAKFHRWQNCTGGRIPQVAEFHRWKLG